MFKMIITENKIFKIFSFRLEEVILNPKIYQHSSLCYLVNLVDSF